MLHDLINNAVISGCFLQLCGGKASEGVFVGAFLSMSSTAVVKLYVNCLMHACACSSRCIYLGE